MKNILFSFSAALVLLSGSIFAAPMGTAFTYQGRLGVGTNVANGSFDVEMRLFDASVAGGQVAGPTTNTSVAVSNGLFTINVDLGGATFDGNARWLGISVRTNGGGAFTTLTPRQELKPTPYALFASHAATAGTVVVGGVGTAGLQTGAVDSTKILDGTIVSGDLSPALLNSTFWKLLGNGGTTAGVNFLGTTDNQPVEIKVNGQRAFRLEPTTNSPNVIGGFSGNYANSVVGVTISGGGNSDSPNVVDALFAPSHRATIGGGSGNAIFDNAANASIGGGMSNVVGSFGDGLNGAPYATIAGGQNNSIKGWLAPSAHSTIGGGFRNTVWAFDHNTIGGGCSNSIGGFSYNGTISGGISNVIYLSDWPSGATIAGGSFNQNFSPGASIGGGTRNLIDGYTGLPSHAAVIGGGSGNTIGHQSPHATIAGGEGNKIWHFANGSAVGGGVTNMIMPFSEKSTISGGVNNQIGQASGATPYAAVIGGGEKNIVTNNFATIAGGSNNVAGGLAASISGGVGNVAADSYSVVSGGFSNSVRSIGGNSAQTASIGGGGANAISDGGSYATIGGGSSNMIGTLGSGGEGGPYATIAGGANNVIRGTSAAGSISGYSTIGGGRFNTIWAMDANTIGGGSGNTIADNHIQFSTIGGGENNRMAGIDTKWASIFGGKSNYVQASYATIAGGFNNLIGSPVPLGNEPWYSAIGGGSGNAVGELCRGATIAGGIGNRIEKTAFVPFPAGAIGGGESNIVSTFYGTVPGGLQATARNYGQMAYASGQFAQPGDAQTSVYVLRGVSTNASETEIFLNGSSARMQVPTNSTWGYDMLITGRSSSNVSAYYVVRGMVENNGGTTTLSVTPTKDYLYEENLAWNIIVDVDDATDTMVIRVVGAPATTIRWVASVRVVEVIY